MLRVLWGILRAFGPQDDRYASASSCAVLVVILGEMPRSLSPSDAVAKARKTVLEGVGVEVAASFPGITRLGGQIVAALYLSDGPRSMDDLSAELGRSKSNIFANVRGLEVAGIVERSRKAGARRDAYALRGKYPDVIIGAYVARLRRVVADKRALSHRAIDILEGARGSEARVLRDRLTKLAQKYERFGILFEELLPGVEGPIDLEALLDGLPEAALRMLATVTRRALGHGPRTALKPSR
jgi:DNA-binding transcriptional regulator GbsR (MarR family)